MTTIIGTPSVAALSSLYAESWWLRDLIDASRDVAVSVVDWRPSTHISAGTFYPRRSTDDLIEPARAVVVSGPVYGDEGSLVIRVLDKATHDAVMLLLTSRRVLLLQDVLPQQWYLKVNGSVQRTPIRAQRELAEPWPVRFAYEITVPVIEVAEPTS